MKLFTAIFLLITLSTTISFAQDAIGTNDFQEVLKKEMTIKKSYSYYQKAIFNTESHEEFIIDFQEIPVNLKSVKLLDENANIILEEDVQNLPSDALYELNIPNGAHTYTLQVDSYTTSFFIPLNN